MLTPLHSRRTQGRCWIEGDNTLNSGDSRTSYGPVSASCSSVGLDSRTTTTL